MKNSEKSDTDVIRIADLSMRFGKTHPIVLQIPNLSVGQGQFVSVIGASGCGKSTLLRLIAGLLEPTFGTVTVDHQNDESGQAQNIGMVFQNANLVPWRNTEQNILLPAELGPLPQTVTAERVHHLLEMVGLSTGDLQKRPSELSGGMQMRVSLARALVLEPALLLMDEPFGALDDVLRMQLEADVGRIHHDQRLTTVLVTHNISEAAFMSDRILVLGRQPSTIMADIHIDLPKPRVQNIRQTSEYHQCIDNVTEVLQSTLAAAQA